MRTFLIAWFAVAWLSGQPAPAKTTPTIPGGDVFEVHSCELYTGGCTASSEATSEGRYLLRVWNFTEGAYRGVELRGLQVALLQVADDNLATQQVHPTRSVIYLPGAATQSQRDALIAWLKVNEPDSARNVAATRVVPMSFTRSGSAASFSAGDSLRLNVRPMAACDTGGCGEALWYTPRATTTTYRVSVAQEAFVREPAVALKWIEHGKRNVFSGQFAQTGPQDNAFSGPDPSHATAHHAHEMSH